MNLTTTRSIDSAEKLRSRWAAVHKTSAPTFEGASQFLSSFSADSVITTLESVIVKPMKLTGNPAIDGPLIRLRVQAALLRDSESGVQE